MILKIILEFSRMHADPPLPPPILEIHFFLRFNACPEKDFGLIDQNSSVLETGGV